MPRDLGGRSNDLGQHFAGETHAGGDFAGVPKRRQDSECLRKGSTGVPSANRRGVLTRGGC